MSTNVQALAQRFIEATVNKWGTDEDAVFDVLKKVHDQKSQTEFAKAISEYSGQSVNSILKDELSGSQLTRAEDLLQVGRETYRSGYLDYFAEGITSPFDWSSGGSKLKVAGGIILIGGLLLLSPAVGTVVGVGLSVVLAADGLGELVGSGFRIFTADSEQEAKKSLVDFGEGLILTTIFVSAPLGFIKGFGQGFVQGWCKGMASTPKP